MGATPFVVTNASRLTEMALRVPLPRNVRLRLEAVARSRANTTGTNTTELEDHLVIICYGINGENVAKTARAADISHVVIDLDADAIKRAQEKQTPAVFGDASDDTILRHVRVQEARVVVVAISDPQATKKIVSRLRVFSSLAYIVVRTRYLREIDEIIKLGADEVIPEEFETSIEIFTRVLKKYLVPSHEISGFIDRIRSSNYDLLRARNGEPMRTLPKLHIPQAEIATLSVLQGDNKVVGKSVLKSKLRSEFGITVLAIKRGEKYITQITPDEKIKQDDVLYLFGKPEDIAQVNEFFKMT